ncbi:phosphoribosylamine--glycine ligase [Candidatus Epulonipiscioides gigas]|nr:phosphoribosylamine--glycine ligase [Epulopiscium sp. SCG-C07WGA-EpuloA2]
MKVLIIGNGGRETAICNCINRQNKDVQLFCTRANPGILSIAENVDISPEDVDGLVDFVAKNNIDFTIVGPEVPLVAGIVDKFLQKGLKIFGPNKECATFEGSKKFTKDFLTKYNIPTAKYQSFTKEQELQAVEALKTYSLPVVIKADGLAAGKGVLICNSYEEATKAIKDIFSDVFKGAGNSLVIEEYLDGVEASLLCFVDGKTIVPMETARDYKRIYDNDQGENTGGMGGFSPNPIINSSLNLQETILAPIINGFKNENLDFRGVLFIGLMIVNNIPYVLEFNVRFGDPETQSVLPRLKTNLLDILISVSNGDLSKINLEWDERCSVTVVLASEGYPTRSVNERRIIYGLDSIDKDVFVFQAGTKQDGADIIVNGGRVLAITALANSLEDARNKVYNQIDKVNFDGMQYRKDIAKI